MALSVACAKEEAAVIAIAASHNFMTSTPKIVFEYWLRKRPTAVRLSSTLILQGGFFLRLQYLGWPTAFNISKYGHNFVIGQDTSIGWHIAFVTRRSCFPRYQSVFDHIEQHGIRMMPGVAGLVVGRRRQASTGQTCPPVRLSLEFCTVARSTVVGVNFFAVGHKCLIGGINECWL